MLNKEDWMYIRTQKEKGVYIKDIATELGVSPRTISRALDRDGPPPGKRPTAHKSILDAYKPHIDKMLKDGVWNAVVITRKLQEQGYEGEISLVRRYITPKRPIRKSRATVRFETPPGQQMQSDWAEIRTRIAHETRRVFFIINELGYSRRFHFWATESMDAEHTYEGIIRAFEYFGGVAQEVLVDNQKAAVISHRHPGRVIFNDRFLDFAGHYGFTPRACRPYRARTKGKAERMVSYIKHHFFQRYREFDNLEQLNQIAETWLLKEADLRFHGTVKEVIKDRFLREAPRLQPLPAGRYDTSYFAYRSVSWDGFIDVQGNRYSVPDSHRGRLVDIRIALDGQLNIYAENKKIAEHRLRPVSEGWSIVPAHHARLWQETLHVEQRALAVYEEVLPCS